MINTLYLGATSACFELAADTAYYAKERFDVFLNGEKIQTSDTNVFSLFDLAPDTAYQLTAAGEDVAFRTTTETCAVDVRQFGAVGDGVHDDTVAIQAAINFLPAGSRIYFPAGTYLSRPLSLKSHLTLEVSENATLLGHPDRAQYPILPGTVTDMNGKEWMTGAFEGLTRPMYQSLIHAEYCEDIHIVGRGAIDGNGQNGDWWTEFRNFPTARPRLMFFCNCKDVTLHGVTGKNGPSWNLHPFYSEHFSCYDVHIQAPKDSPNTDAIDPEACKGVNIIGCRLSVGDDCIAIKSGKIELSRQRLQAASDHVIRNCLMEFGHGAVTLGSETACGVKDLTVSHCLFNATDRGLRIKTRRGRGKNCDITGIVFEHIEMNNVITPFVINMWYNCCDSDRFSDYVKSREKLPVDDRTPHLGSFIFRNIHCENAHAAACYIDGLPEAPIDSVTFENVSVTFAKDATPFVPAMQNDAVKHCKLGLYLSNVRKVTVRDTVIRGCEGPALITENCESVVSDVSED